MADQDKRRLTFIENTKNFGKDQKLPDMRGWEVWSRDDKALGTVDELIGDMSEKSPRYVDIELKETLLEERKAGRNLQNLALPVGLGQVDRQNRKLILDRADPDLIRQVPLHKKGKLPSYEQEMKTRAIFEQEDQAYPKTGMDRPAGPAGVKDVQGEAINEQMIDPEEGRKRDVDVNEKRLADENQGQYTPNLSGDAEGVKKRATNAEGKHDIAATSGNPESPDTSDTGNELHSAAAPDRTEVPSTDSPGETLGRAELDNQHRDPENKDLPPPQGPPQNPLNANDDFYQHEMFNAGHLLKK